MYWQKFDVSGVIHVQKTRCIYGRNESHMTNSSDDDNEIILISAKKTHHAC